MHYKFCPECGSKLIEKNAGDDGNVPYCDSCKQFWFDGFASCVIVLVYNEFDEIALSWQSYLSDSYATLTSGYITPGENAEETAIREVKEELGLDVERLDYAGTFWFAPREQLMHGFLAFAPKKELAISQELEAAKWVPALEAPQVMIPKRPGNTLHKIYDQFLVLRGLSYEGSAQ